VSVRVPASSPFIRTMVCEPPFRPSQSGFAGITAKTPSHQAPPFPTKRNTRLGRRHAKIQTAPTNSRRHSSCTVCRLRLVKCRGFERQQSSCSVFLHVLATWHGWGTLPTTQTTLPCDGVAASCPKDHASRVHQWHLKPNVNSTRQTCCGDCTTGGTHVRFQPRLA